MLKKLQYKFILINMLFVSIVVAVVFAAVCVYVYSSERAKVNDLLTKAINIREEDVEHWVSIPELGAGIVKDPVHSFDGNAITVQLNKNNELLSTIELNATISEEALAQAVSVVLRNGDENGSIRSMNIIYLRTETPRGTRIAFTDTGEFYSSVRTTILVSGLLCLVILALMLLVSIFLSSVAMRPVKEAWAKQKQFVADASHELKTPLTVILANNNILQSHPEEITPEQQQWLASTQEEASRMKQLIDQMLFLAKSDAEQSPVTLSKINLSEIAERSALTFEPVAFEKRVTIASSITPNIQQNSDRSLFERLLHILLDNAVKHAERGSTVTLTLHREGSHTVMTVNNAGDIIGEADLPHIFDRFYRADKARTNGNGYGLGLAIAKNILDTLGGTVSVTSKENSGTTFRIVF